ncbi:MAG: hypothetical protein Kow0069_05930 [Promethearchaeota archaeon]
MAVQVLRVPEQLREVPDAPGVYAFLGESGDASPTRQAVYVGKSKRLARRVRSYFRSSGGLYPREGHDRAKLAAIKGCSRVLVVEVGDEVSALILEDLLIHRLDPPLNRTRKPVRKNFLKLTSGAFPKLEHTKRVVADGSTYFGPVGGFQRFRPVLRALNATFRLRTCEHVPSFGCRPPLECGVPQVARLRCVAPCLAATPEEFEKTKREYGRNVDAMRRFFSDPCALLDSLNERVARLAAELRFEEASLLRDRLVALQRLTRGPLLRISGPEELKRVGALAEQVTRLLTVRGAEPAGGVEARRHGPG